MEMDQVLSGKRILVTRPIKQARSLSNLIEKHGGIPMEVPLITIEPPRDKTQVERVIESIDKYSWMVFTSSNGVEHFFNHYTTMFQSWMKMNRPRIAVVGKKTLFSLEKYGLHADVVPEEFVAEGLIGALLPKLCSQDQVLIVKGNLARDTIRQQLEANNITTTELIIYETTINNEKKEELTDMILNRSIDVVTFTSSSTVHSFSRMIQGLEDYIDSIPIACIGPITEKTAKQLGFSVSILPVEYTVEGLVSEIISYFEKGGSNNEKS